MPTAITNSINNTCGKSNSGVTQTFTIQNQSNTASSQAQTLITVGGGTAGDAYTTYNVSGVTNWSEGVDNSDSDAYVLAASSALGTTNVIHSTTAGEINYPLQPSFLAYQSGTLSNVSGDGTLYTVVFNVEVYDQNSDFSSTTFTAPVTGRYLFASQVAASTPALSGTLTWYSNIPCSNRIIAGMNLPTREQCIGFYGVNTTISLHCSGIVDMDAADTASVSFYAQSGAKTSNLNGSSDLEVFFCGQLIA